MYKIRKDKIRKLKTEKGKRSKFGLKEPCWNIWLCLKKMLHVLTSEMCSRLLSLWFRLRKGWDPSRSEYSAPFHLSTYETTGKPFNPHHTRQANFVLKSPTRFRAAGTQANFSPNLFSKTFWAITSFFCKICSLFTQIFAGQNISDILLQYGYEIKLHTCSETGSFDDFDGHFDF